MPSLRTPTSPAARLASGLLVLALVAAACDRGGEASPTDASPSKARDDETAPSPAAAAAPSADELARWRASCPESMLRAGPSEVPPPPPPPPSDGVPTTLPGGPVTMPTIGPAPARYGKVPRPRGSTLAAELGLGEGSCDPGPVVALHGRHGSSEEVYCAVAFAYEQCGQLDRAMEWTERRAKEFPKSADARLGLAVRRFAALLPEPGSAWPWNDELSATERIAIATQVLADLRATFELSPEDRAAWMLASLAHVQRSLAWQQGATPETAEGLLLGVLARKELMEGYRYQTKMGRSDGRSDCTPDSVVPCIPPPPYDETEQSADAELEARLLGQK